MNRQQKKYLAIAKDLAIKKGGECLSNEYSSNRTPLKWKCDRSHTWLAPLRNINERGNWCPECRNNERRENLYRRVKIVLEQKRWKLMKGLVKGYKDKTITVTCQHNHTWKTSPQGVFYNGCPECSNRSDNKEKHIREIKKFVKGRGGRILDGEYLTLESAFVIECDKKHQWNTKGAYLKNKRWCPVCAGRDKKEQLKDIKKIALARNGKCLSNEYIQKDHKLEFMCVDGHEFRMTPHNVKAGQWCPRCTWYKSEHKARYVFEKLLKHDFHPNGTVVDKYILDGYTELPDGKKIAFEYNGKQHYEYIGFFHENYEEFVKRQMDDMQKEQLCKARNIQLIVIPYFAVETDEKLLHFIQGKLESICLPTPSVDDINLFFADFYKTSPVRERLEKIICTKGGSLLTQHYNGRNGFVTVKCSWDHVWTTKAQNILTNRWCPECGGVLRDKDKLYKNLKEAVERKGGKLIDKVYISSNAKVTVICKEDHEFQMKANNIVNNNQWCPKCRKVSRDKKWQYNQLKGFIERKGGTLITKEYTLSRNKVKVKCHRGHIFEKTVNNIKSHNQWCPKCKKKDRYKRNCD